MKLSERAKKFLKEIGKGLWDRAIVITITIIITLFTSGALSIWRLGGVYYNLPTDVKALQDDLNDVDTSVVLLAEKIDLYIETQQEINKNNRESLIIQAETNARINKELVDIKEQYRDINEYLLNN